ncbi:hypothetical protein H7171_03125 [Candidatus Saccharibacteria bacterium]|nr:hypothetical protein [Candidatus Saccharibacteria bacterium]
MDLAIAAAILVKNEQNTYMSDHAVLVGELGLNGRTRTVHGIIGKLLADRDLGIELFFVPASSQAQAKLVPHIKIIPISSLKQLYEHLTGIQTVPMIITRAGDRPPSKK